MSQLTSQLFVWYPSRRGNAATRQLGTTVPISLGAHSYCSDVVDRLLRLSYTAMRLGSGHIPDDEDGAAPSLSRVERALSTPGKQVWAVRGGEDGWLFDTERPQRACVDATMRDLFLSCRNHDTVAN